MSADEVSSAWQRLSPVQEGMWFMQRLAPDSGAWHLARAFHLRGALDIATPGRALARVRQRQAVLRTRFEEREGTPYQIADLRADAPLDVLDLSELDDEARHAELARVLEGQAQRPFDLAHEGAARFRLVRLAPDWHVLSVVVHHLISDGGSNAIFAREFAQAWRDVGPGANGATPITSPEWQYADFAAWQRTQLASDKAQADLAWWKQYIGTPDDSFELPGDFARTSAAERRALTHTFALRGTTLDALRTRCKAARCTPFVVLMAAYQLLLWRHAGSRDFCIGVPTSGRTLAECEDLIGLFIDTRVHRARIDPAMTVHMLIESVRGDARAALDHADVTLPMLVDALGVRREADRHPLFQTLFNVQGAAAAGRLSLDGLDVEIVDAESPLARFDLSFDVRVAADAVNVTVRYDASRYRPETIARLCAHYEALLAALCADPECAVAELPYLSVDERAQLAAWSTAHADYGTSVPVHRLFEREAAAYPDAPALLFGDLTLSYAELDARANRLAQRLRRLGVGPDVKVGIGVERSVEMVVGLFAILKAGGAYVPLDPDYPAERLAYMIEDSGIGLLLTQHALRERFAALIEKDTDNESCRVIELDTLDLSNESGACPDVTLDAENLAYVIYTSGSTGRPKGAANRHGALYNRLAWMQAAYRLDARDTVLQKTPFSFDVSVWEFFWPLMTGARLALARPGDHRDPARLTALIDTHRVTTLHFVPPMLQAFVAALDACAASACASLRQIVCSGEALPATLQDQTLARLPHVQVHNLYGPTEAAIDVTHWTCRAGDAVVPIGRPIANVSTHVLDAALNPLPAGVAGELYLGGAGLARGYLNRPALTAERFVPDPFEPGARLYRTGDLARWRADGALDYLGRLDHQVKIRGFRIELGEIEAVLQRQPGVETAVVTAQDGPNGKRLVAYVSARAGQRVERETLAAGLAAELPDYMVPAAWVELACFPLSPNGKIDRRALPQPGQDERAWEAPQGVTEDALATIWQQVLGVARVGRHDNFFELGGDSILSLQIVERARQAGWKLTPRQLFERQSVAQLAAVAQALDANAAAQAMLEAPVGTPGALLPMQAWFFDQPIAQRHHWNQAVLLTSRAPLDTNLLARALHALVVHHAALRMHYEADAAGVWHARHGEAPAPESLLWVRHAASADEIQALCDDAQRSLDLANGPLLRALAIAMPDGSWRLMLAIHHLAVDGVSWRLLIGQWRDAYAALQNGAVPNLPPVMASTDLWAGRLAAHARTPALQDELRYWQEVARVSAALPCDFPEGANTVAQQRHVALTLDRAQTHTLLHDAAAAWRTQVNDLLLTALGRALSGWMGDHDRRIRIDLEGHGREDLFDDVDLSGTVGWFTSLYPVVLDVQGDPGAALRRVKETLRAVPARGIGYGVLRYLGNEAALRSLEPSQVVFNYLGQFDQHFDEAEAWQPARELAGSQSNAQSIAQATSQSAGAPLAYALAVSGKVLDGALTLTIGYSGARYRDATVERLAVAFGAALRELIAQCTHARAGATPSDFPLAALGQDELDALPLALADVADLYPLSPMQAGMLFHALYARGGSVYLNQLRVDLDGLDAGRFRAAWHALTQRHDILRTGFVAQGEGWLQWIARAVELPIEEHDWRNRADQDGLDIALDTFAAEQLERGFDLSRAPLHRLALIRTGERRYHFVWTHHHLLMDGWSVSQLLGEVLRHYSGQALPVHSGRYRDYIGWLQGQDKAASAAHWQAQIARLDGPTHLAEAMPKRNTQVPDAASHYALHTLELDAATTARLVAFVREERVTVNTLLQAAWALLLQRYTHQPAVVFGATLAGRPADLPGAAHLLGLFINTLPVVAEPRAHRQLGDWLRELQAQGMAAQEHAHTPLHEIQRWAGASGQGLFDTLVVFENYPVDAVLKDAQPGGLAIDKVSARDETSYALTLGVTQGETLRLGLRYARDAFSDADAERLAQQMARLLREAALTPGAAQQALGAFDPLDEVERDALIELGCADTSPADSIDTPVHRQIAARAAHTPDALAIVAGDTRMTYAELNTRANRLAHRLMHAGVGPEVRVGLAVSRGAQMIVAMLAVMKAGGAYVPLDPAYPAERLAYMIEDSGIGLLLAQPTDTNANAMLAAASLPVVNLDAPDLADEPPHEPQCTVQAGNLAYVIYTSGSTGRPKGVGVAHGALAMHCAAIGARYAMTAADRELHFASINFDIAHERWIVPLCAGGALVIAEPARWTTAQLIEAMRRERVSVVFLTPSYLNNLVAECALDTADASDAPLALRLCIVGGEAWSAQAMQAACRALPGCRLINAYGPTETVIAPTAWDVDPAFEGTYAPIGRQIGERVAYVFDAAMNLAPRGVAGELYLGGAALARGYLQRPALTAERFVPDPFDAAGGRLYRTGDLVRWRDDGALEYLGRLDQQVKLRGFRVELGEVEAALLAQPGVREAVALVEGGTRLLAYVTPQTQARVDELDPQALKHALARTLPDYMVPAAIVVLDALPLTPNGKIDRRALPVPQAQASEDYAAPQGATEAALARLWSKVLGIERVGRHAHFFELGGDSILSLKLQRRVAREFGVEVALAALFAAPTLDAYARAVDEARAQGSQHETPIADTLQSLLSDLMQ
ncbi:non-ribosomal peptide synthetase [Paraburkholderia sp. J67]|uniref:non-ribosomal peptide synthetase n=1 Tax=Paraburkholderia sp. J67 TaxID=2805435 RepID=UPI002ABD4C4F|nr:non-ribosomal peptide synthetase [Paraburkholderia sp. J67]